MKQFFRQLQDRHVFKVGIAYLVMAWVVMQIVDVIFPALNLPGWSITLTLALLAVGFPVSLVLAWVFDIKPSGIEKTLFRRCCFPPKCNYRDRSRPMICP